MEGQRTAPSHDGLVYTSLPPGHRYAIIPIIAFTFWDTETNAAFSVPLAKLVALLLGRRASSATMQTQQRQHAIGPQAEEQQQTTGIRAN